MSKKSVCPKKFWVKKFSQITLLSIKLCRQKIGSKELGQNCVSNSLDIVNFVDGVVFVVDFVVVVVIVHPRNITLKFG